MAVVVLAGTRWYRGANICATVLVRILFRLPRSIALRDKYGMERIEMVYEESARLGDTQQKQGRALGNPGSSQINYVYQNEM